MPAKGHNYGICRKCGEDHGVHPMLGKHFSDEAKDNMLKAQNRPEVKDHLSEVLKEKWGDPDMRKMWIESMNRPEVKERCKVIRSNLATTRWQDPVYRERVTEALVKAQNRPEVREKRMKTRSTPEYKEQEANQLRAIRIKKPTSPQRELFDKIKLLFPNEEVKLEFVFILNSSLGRVKGNFYLIDVAIPTLKLGFEYDGSYYHKKAKFANPERDIRRHKEIEAQGWTLIHYEKVSDFKKC